MMTKTQIKNYIREEIIEILTPAEAEETADALAQAADSAERIEKALSEEKELTYNDFVSMARADMMAGAAPDEYPSDKQVKNYADFLYGEYLKGVSVDDLFEVTLSEEEVEEPTDAELRKSEDIVDVASKMTETAKEMKSLAKQYKAAEGEEKEDILKRLKELTKIKKELEGLI